VPLAQRQLCAARLLTLADSLDKAAAQHGKGGGAQQQVQQAQQAQQGQEFLAGVVGYVVQLRGSGAATLATPPPGDERAAAAAADAADALQGVLARLAAAATGGPPARQQRARALLHLLRLLLLHTLADPASADPGLAADLDAVVAVAVEGRPAPQPGADKRGGDGERSSSDGVGEGDDDGSEGGGEAAPHWHDTLMDVLLSLLARAAAPLPSAPLRDAAEHAFRAFAEDLTATGGCGSVCVWEGRG
jgi:hypothetical protein